MLVNGPAPQRTTSPGLRVDRLDDEVGGIAVAPARSSVHPRRRGTRLVGAGHVVVPGPFVEMLAVENFPALGLFLAVEQGERRRRGRPGCRCVPAISRARRVWSVS